MNKEKNAGVTVSTFLLVGLFFVPPMLGGVFGGCFFLLPQAPLSGREVKDRIYRLLPFLFHRITVERFAYSIYGIGLTTLVITVLLTGLLYRKVYEKVLHMDV